jgi:hypothetical protein
MDSPPAKLSVTGHVHGNLPVLALGVLIAPAVSVHPACGRIRRRMPQDAEDPVDLTRLVPPFQGVGVQELLIDQAPGHLRVGLDLSGLTGCCVCLATVQPPQPRHVSGSSRPCPVTPR